MDSTTDHISKDVTYDMLASGGEMGALIRKLDWAATPIGPLDHWPQSLRTAVSICLASSFPMLLWWGPELVMLYNDAYRPILGETKHPRAMGQRGRACWPEVWDIIGPMLDHVLTRGQATWSNDQLLMLERNGYPEECYFTFSYSPIRDESGGVGGVFTAVTETTARVLGERRLRLLRELGASTARTLSIEETCARATETLAQNPADLPFTLLYLLEADGASARLVGATGIAAGLDISPARVPLAAEAPWPFAETLASQEPHIVHDLATRLADAGLGDQIPHTAAILPVAQASQTAPYGVLVAGINPHRALDEEYQGFLTLVAGQLATTIANARAYEEERRRAEALAELDRAKTAFFSNVSHEFRTPLTLLLGPLEDLLADTDDPLSANQREQLALAQRNSLRLLKLVNTLLDFTRIEAGRVQATFVPTDLAALTADLASNFRSLCEKAGLRLVVECAPLPEPVYVDREMWEKIVLNLLSNAFKHTFAGEIAVLLRSVDGQVELVVRDTGEGIAPADVPHIFDRFYRATGARARTHEGSGIGLALVRELIRLHGGAVAVESALGQGTTFRVTIPRGAAHVPAERIEVTRSLAATVMGAAPFVQEARRWLPNTPGEREETADWLRQGSGGVPSLVARGAPTQPARILLADDNADLRDYLRRLLGERYMVEAVSDGVVALQAARERPPDLVLADVMMPNLDGFGLLRELRADVRTRATPVILLSARAGEEATIEGLAAGADDYLVKPFSAREVLARVAARIEIARLRKDALAHAQELESILAAMADGVVIYDASGSLLKWNAALAALLEFDQMPDYAAQPVGTRPARIHVRDAHDQPLAPERLPFMRAVRGEILTGTRAVDLTVTLPSGRVANVNASAAPLRDDAGHTIGAVVIYRDVTERRALERRTHEVLRAVLDMAASLMGSASAPEDGAPAVDTTSDLVEARVGGSFAAAPDLDTTQRAVREVLALAQRVLVGQYTSSLIVNMENGDLRPLAVVGLTPKIERQWWKDLSQRKLSDYYSPEQCARMYAEEIMAVDFAQQPPLNGQDYFNLTSVLIIPVRLDAQRLLLVGVEARDRATFTPQERDLAQAAARLAALVVERDRLSRKRAEAEASALALAHTKRQMDEFMGVASHEMRTPLTTITANVQLAERQVRALRETPPGEEVTLPMPRIERLHDLLVRTDRQALRLDRLVGDLLDISRIDAGKLQLRLEPGDLVAIVQEAVLGERAAWPARVITLDLRRVSTLPVLADADRIGQVITNYLTNALKYSASDQPVAVRLRVQGHMARVSVRDHGPGLAPEQQRKVWERFYRAPGIEPRSGSGVGLGLGLAICQTIISRHGGQVGIKSASGQGANFWFTLPLASDASPARLDAADAPPAPGAS